MMRLLVSVRDAAEARIALEAGVDLIDVKEPLRGALGAANPEEIAAIARVVGGRLPVSAALGELFVGPVVVCRGAIDGVAARRETHLPNERDVLANIQFAKFGLAGANRFPDWQSGWAAAIGNLPAGVQSVAVAYADWRSCDAPPPEAVIDAGAQLGCTAFLIDTYDKLRGGLLAHCPLDELSPLLEIAKNSAFLTVVGGSLNPPSIRQIASLQPDFVAVRTAVCGSDRSGRLEKQRVEALVKLLLDLGQSAVKIP